MLRHLLPLLAAPAVLAFVALGAFLALYVVPVLSILIVSYAVGREGWRAL